MVDNRWKAILDGAVGKDGERWDGSYCEELMDNGIQHAKKAVTEDLQFYNMFEEWIDCTLDGGVQCNTATIYNFGNKNHEDVRSAVARMRQDGMKTARRSVGVLGSLGETGG